MKIAGIVYDSFSDGDGVRTVIFTQGCSVRCEGCHNKHTWDFNDGVEMSDEEIMYNIQKYSISKKVTISGGNPLEQGSKMLGLLKKLKDNGYHIWLYSGFTLDYIRKAYPNHLKYIDVLVDDKFDEELKNETIKFRGSENQSIYYISDGRIMECITTLEHQDFKFKIDIPLRENYKDINEKER